MFVRQPSRDWHFAILGEIRLCVLSELELDKILVVLSQVLETCQSGTSTDIKDPLVSWLTP